MNIFNKNMKKAMDESIKTAKENAIKKARENQELQNMEKAIKQSEENAKRKEEENYKLKKPIINGTIATNVGSINFNKESVENVIETLKKYNNNRNKINAIQTIKNNSKIHIIIKALFGNENNNGMLKYISLVEKLNSQNALPAGFTEIIVLGDGSCFFHAIMKYYELNNFNGFPFDISNYIKENNKKNKKLGYALRRATINYFINTWRTKHITNESVVNLNKTLKELQEFDTGKKNIKHLDTYAQDNVPRCVCDLLNINILIWSPTIQNWYDAKTQYPLALSNRNRSKETIYLILKNAHYNLLLPNAN